MDPFGGVVVASGDNFNDLVAWKLEGGNVAGAASHEVAVENAKHGFMGDD